MVYNIPLELILQKLTDIDNKLSILVDNQSIDMLEEMEKEEIEEKKNVRKSKRGANKCM